MSTFFKLFVNIVTLLIFSTSCGCITLADYKDLVKAPRHSFVKIVVVAEDYDSTGSGIIINHVGETTLILTAGHICKDSILNMTILDHFENKHESLAFIRSTEDDLCIIVTNSIPLPAIGTADKKTIIGDIVYNIAAPMGIHAPNMALVFEGHYQGAINIKDEKHSLDIHSVSGMGGSSGSPVFNKEWQIIGVVSRGITDFQHIMLCVNEERTKAFIDYSFTKVFEQEINVAIERKNQKLIDIMNKLMKQ
jgi:S1-C subfamily serine protease